MTGPREALELALKGRYRIEREIGRGGMATVFLATDLAPAPGGDQGCAELPAGSAASVARDRRGREPVASARAALIDSGGGRPLYPSRLTSPVRPRAKLERERHRRRRRGAHRARDRDALGDMRAGSFIATSSLTTSCSPTVGSLTGSRRKPAA
jgi:hypothetical protein